MNFFRLVLMFLLGISSFSPRGMLRAAAGAERPVVVATTTMIGSMLDLLAGDKLDKRVLIPPASCPGHFDLKPRDAARLSQAALVIRHDFQQYLDRRLRAQNPQLEVAVLATSGHLVVPANYLDALTQVKKILDAHFSSFSPVFAANFPVAQEQIREAEKAARKRVGKCGLAGLRVLASFRQAGFARWAGLEVCATFTNSPDELSVRRLKEIVRTAWREKAVFIVGNLHSGGEAVARAIGTETGLPACLLSNFPGTNERNQTYSGLLLDNIDRLARAAAGQSVAETD